MRRDAKKDDNHNKISNQLIRFGFSVMDTSQLGFSKPDMIIAIRGETAVVEIKSEEGDLSTGQIEFKRLWRGKYIVARCVNDILKEFKMI
jgi:hypothetical protein